MPSQQPPRRGGPPHVASHGGGGGGKWASGDTPCTAVSHAVGSKICFATFPRGGSRIQVGSNVI